MQVTIAREAFLPALTLAVKASDTRGTIPILAHVHLSVADGVATIVGTNMEVAGKTCVPAEGANGVCVLPGKPLLAFIKSLAKGSMVQISADGDNAEVSCGDLSANLAVMSPDDFPAFTLSSDPVEFTMSAADLARMFRHVRPSISTEATRYYLNGAFLECCDDDGRAIRAVATDGHRLTRSEAPMPAGLELNSFTAKLNRKDGGVIVPTSGVVLVLDMLGKAPQGDVTVSVAAHRISVHYGNRAVISKLVDGKFPEYRRVIPSGNENLLTTNAADLAAAAKGVADAVSKDTMRAVKLELDSGCDCMISASDTSGSKSRRKLNGITRYEGEPLEVGFQARYVRDLMGVISGTVRIAFDRPSSPAVITCESEPGYLSVLMPIRV